MTSFIAQWAVSTNLAVCNVVNSIQHRFRRVRTGINSLKTQKRSYVPPINGHVTGSLLRKLYAIRYLAAYIIIEFRWFGGRIYIVRNSALARILAWILRIETYNLLIVVIVHRSLGWRQCVDILDLANRARMVRR